MKGSAEEHEKDDRYDWCGHHGGFVPAVRRIQPMLELFETGSMLGVIRTPLFTMKYERANILPKSIKLNSLVLGCQS